MVAIPTDRFRAIGRCMHIRTGYELIFEIPAPVPMLLLLYTHTSRARDLRRPERILFEPEVQLDEFIDACGNRCARLVAPAGRFRITNDIVVQDTGEHDVVIPASAEQHAVDQLPTDVLQFMLGSRYCEVDRLSDIAWNLFGHTPL